MVNAVNYIILALMGISFGLAFGNIRWKLPLITIANRWFRLALFSLFLAYFVHGWEIFEQSFFVLFVTSFLGWFLVESILVWINIRTLNYSAIALFPRFSIDRLEIKWPNLKRFIQLKEIIRSNGFKKVQSIKASLVGSLIIRSLIYKDFTGKILLQILFFPQKNGISRVYFILTSLTTGGRRFITDNLDMPFGGYMPDDWLRINKPLCDSLIGLLKNHLKYLNDSDEDFTLWDEEPLNEINRQQSILEYHNIKKRFLNPPNLHEDYGKLTSEGCYRLWKHFLFLKYTGLSLT